MDFFEEFWKDGCFFKETIFPIDGFSIEEGF